MTVMCEYEFKDMIDAMFNWLETHFPHIQHIDNFYELYGMLYEIGSQWEHYKELFN